MNAKLTTCPTPMQELILTECKRQCISVYRLAELSGILPNHIYDYLKRPTSHLHVEMMLAALGVEFIKVGKAKHGRRFVAAVVRR